MNSGKLVIIGIFSVALIASVVAWQHQRSLGSRTLALWGGDHAFVVRHGKQVELAQVNLEAGSRLEAGSDDYSDDSATAASGLKWRAISGKPGIVHARQALISDASFDWDSPPPAESAGGAPHWEFALRFTDDELGESVMLFDLTNAWVQAANKEDVVKLTIADGLSTFFAERLAE